MDLRSFLLPLHVIKCTLCPVVIECFYPVLYVISFEQFCPVLPIAQRPFSLGYDAEDK